MGGKQLCYIPQLFKFGCAMLLFSGGMQVWMTRWLSYELLGQQLLDVTCIKVWLT